MKHIVSRMSSYFPNRWPLSYLNLTKNMKTYIRRQQHKKFSKHQDIKQKEPPQKYRLGTISNTKLLAGLNRFNMDTISTLTDHMNKRLGEVDSKFDNLLADLVPPTQNASANSTANRTGRHNPESGESVIECSTKPKGDHTLVKMRPQNYNGTTIFDDPIH